MPSRASLKSRVRRCRRKFATTWKRLPAQGGTPLVVAENATALGVIYLKDIVKGGLKDRLARLRAMGIRTIMITGDNPLTAAVIAREAGVDDFLAEAKPKDKMDLIKREQGKGKLVAMTGDGTNDAPALAQADVGVAMNSGTQAAKEAGNMVDLDSNPTKLIEIVEIGKQLLMTRGALTTFSIANDVAKYFAIIPAMFAGVFPVLDALNIMYLHSPQSAILSAVIFNALIIVALIPLALEGREVRAQGRRHSAAPQPADLRRRRHHRSVHRHQGHRHVPGSPAPGIIARSKEIQSCNPQLRPLLRITRRSSHPSRTCTDQPAPAKHSVWRTSIRFTLLTTVLLGLGYPLLVTGIAAAVFPHKAAGSLILKDGQVIGSELLAQSFTSDRYFHPRPSAAGNGYDATSSGGSNLAQSNAKLVQRIQGDIDKLRGRIPASPCPSTWSRPPAPASIRTSRPTMRTSRRRASPKPADSAKMPCAS